MLCPLLHMSAVYLLLISVINSQTLWINQLTLHHRLAFLSSVTLHVSTNFNNTSWHLKNPCQVWIKSVIKNIVNW